MSEIEAMDIKDFMSLVGQILESQNTNTGQGSANTMAACMFVHNHLLYDAEFSRHYNLVALCEEPDEQEQRRCKLYYPALPPSLDIPNVWTDGPTETVRDEVISGTIRIKKRRPDDSPTKSLKKSE